MAIDRVDVLVVGAGVIGLAIAREFARAKKEVVIIDRQTGYGTGTSARNSGVIHAGIYYPVGSKKAQWCVEGRRLLYEFADRHHVSYRRLGKLIVAQRTELSRLSELYETGLANGVEDLQLISGDGARLLEPEVRCDAAIFSPSTGIIDAHELMHALLGDAEQHGALLAVGSRFESAQSDGKLWRCKIGGDSLLECDVLINSAGLDAHAVARCIEPLDHKYIPKMYFAKGNYARLNGRPPFTRLIYPVPVAGGLGTHLTLDLGGQANFGPDVEWLSDPTEQQLEEGLVQSLSYQVSEKRLSEFATDIAHWWPNITKHALSPGYAGVRPKLSAPGEPAHDFVLQSPKDHGLPGLANLFGMESPGLTSALAIGRAVREIFE